MIEYFEVPSPTLLLKNLKVLFMNIEKEGKVSVLHLSPP
jgi:hypothetical protein